MRKQVICGIFLLTITLSSFAQNKPASQKPKTTVAASPLKTLEDSANYALGLSVVNFFSKQQGIQKINTVLLSRAINDALAGRKLLLTDEVASNVLMSYFQKAQTTKAQPNITAGQKFLAENKKKPGVKTTPSGLQYEVLQLGTGPIPTLTDSVVCHYKGSFLNGTVFEDSYSRGMPIEYPITGFIKGWTEALQLMPAGSKFKLYIPYNLAYGPNDYNTIPGGSLLIFELELLKVKGKG